MCVGAVNPLVSLLQPKNPQFDVVDILIEPQMLMTDKEGHVLCSCCGPLGGEKE